jgi:DNA-3-methyladenine glycosylase II
MSIPLTGSFALPDRYRRGDFLAFHSRDAQQVAERVDGQGLSKGLMWDGAPARLEIHFESRRAHARLSVDGEGSVGRRAEFPAMVGRMLGLTQRVEEFEQRYRDHPHLGLLIAHQAGLRVPLAASPFEALTWAVTGQQISVGAAVALRRRLIAAAGVRHSSGLLCHPDAARLAELSQDDLRRSGFSATKAKTLAHLAQLVAGRQLPLDEWMRMPPVEDMREQLLSVRGIGPWTVSYVLLRGFGWLDGSLHGDVAVRRGLQILLGSAEKLSIGETEAWLAPFTPWRALIAAHLWTAQSAASY